MRFVKSDHNAAVAGFTLLEVATAVALLTLALLGLASGFAANAQAHHRAEDDIHVLHALREIAETIRGVPFDEIVTKYQGKAFDVTEIGGRGSVTVFVDETASSLEARLLGLPRDLDGDGTVSNADVSGNYLLLPIRVQLSWGADGDTESRVLDFLLSY